VLVLQRSDWILIVTLLVISIAAGIAIGVLTVMGATEYIEFAIAIILMVAILVGSYFFIIIPTPRSRWRERDTE
jgi:hypothetical protein